MMKEIGSVIATEGRAKYNENQKYGDRDIYKGLTFWAPNVNIFRDPTDIAVQSGTLDVGDDLVYNADQFFVVLCRRQSLNGNTCSHNQYLLKIGAGSRAENENAPAGSAGKGVQTHEQKTVMFPTLA